MKIKTLLTAVICTIFLQSCSLLNKTSSEFTSDTYKSKMNGDSVQTIYVENADDTLKIYSKDVANKDFSKNANKIYVSDTNKKQTDALSFYKNSLDVDFLTIPFKYRPNEKNLPKQFTTNLNGAVFLGRRTDRYKLKYSKDPLNKYHRNITHHGFSFGVFTGFGATAMNPWVTEEKISQEYDGLVWSKGVAGIIGINNFTVGIAVGFDNLLDKNRKVWIYQQKLWYGLAFGLNLN